MGVRRWHWALAKGPAARLIDRMIRAADLDHFLLTLRRAMGAATEPGSPPALLAERIFSALGTPGPAVPKPAGQRPDIREGLDRAFANAARLSGDVPRVAGALRAMDRRLPWARRLGSEADPDFLERHANAVIIGEGGLERSSEARIGVSFLRAGAGYVDHSHPPEEVYYVLSGGEWFREDRGWHEPGPGRIVHNPPDILHNMRAKDEPLLAIWCLWTGAVR